MTKGTRNRASASAPRLRARRPNRHCLRSTCGRRAFSCGSSPGLRGGARATKETDVSGADCRASALVLIRGLGRSDKKLCLAGSTPAPMVSDDRPSVFAQNRPQFASFIQISDDRLTNINGLIPKNRQIAETSLPNLEVVMVGITLSPEQIRNAPPEVRRWLGRTSEHALDSTGKHLAVEA